MLTCSKKCIVVVLDRKLMYLFMCMSKNIGNQLLSSLKNLNVAIYHNVLNPHPVQYPLLCIWVTCVSVSMVANVSFP